MKISPVSSQATTVATENPMVQKVRSLKMNVNRTPGYIKEEEIESPATSSVETHGAPAQQPVELSIPDTVTEQTTQTSEETQPLSPQFAALAKQRRALQQERQALDREKAELAAQKTPQGDVVALADLKKNALRTLLNNGVTFDQLTQELMANEVGFNPDVQNLKREIEELKTGFTKTLSEKEAQAEQQALSEMRREADRLSAQGDDFQLVRETKSVPTVMKLIEQTYRKHNEVLDVREALKLVEDDLFERTKKLAQLQKVQSGIMPPQSAQPTQQQRQMKTLTNRDTASVPLSRKARALAAMNGTLKT